MKLQGNRYLTSIGKPWYFSLRKADELIFISLDIQVESIFEYTSKLLFPFLLDSLYLKEKWNLHQK